MLEAYAPKDDEISLLALGTTLVKSRWRIVRWMLVGAVAAALTILTRPRTYEATASFFPSQSGEASRSGLASLAGQVGIFLPTGNQSLSPDFYSNLVQSRVVLLPIARDTLIVDEMGGKRITALNLFNVPAGPTISREEQGVTKLRRTVGVSVAKATGIVRLSVTTPWRSVSIAIASALIDGINEYNERTRQGQATGERKFIEGRLTLASGELRDAENRLEGFLATNRNLGSSPELSMERDRLQRDVGLRQQVFTALTQSYEEARIREVRDIPVITVFEPPFAPSLPKPRGLLIGTILGGVLGGLIGVLLAFTSGLLTRRRQGGNTEAEEFAIALKEAKGELFGGVKRLKVRMRR